MPLVLRIGKAPSRALFTLIMLKWPEDGEFFWSVSVGSTWKMGIFGAFVVAWGATTIGWGGLASDWRSEFFKGLIWFDPR